MSWTSADLLLFDYYLYEAGHLISILFTCFIIKPLWTLAMGRPVLLIVFNKAILSLIDGIGTLLQRTSTRVKWDPLETTLFIWRLQIKLMHDVLVYGILLNIIALALNRMHCIMWPFHYNGWIKKSSHRKIVIQCILIWILAMLIAEGMRLHNTKFSSFQLHTYIFYVAIGLYMIVGAKLAWKKCSSNNMLQSESTEKDFNKITIVCLAGLVPNLLSFSAQAVGLTNLGDQNLMLRIYMQIVQSALRPFIYCADELCLIVLLADFRRIIKKFLRSIFCRWKNGSANNSQNVKNIIIMPNLNDGMLPTSSVAP